MSSHVEILDVTKRFGSHVAVDSVSFAVPAGSFFSLLGPSGCGKSTTLRMLSGFEHPDNGRILIDGEDVGSAPPYRRPTNMVFQRWALFPHMTVYNNVAFGLQVDRVAASEIRARVMKMLELVGLEAFTDRKPGQLSGGQMQRVALARALVKEPKVLLLDEPLGALDLKLRHQMQMELKRIQREIGTTFIYVTHDQGEAMTMSDTIAVMNDGRIEQIDEPQNIYDSPKTRFVADFIGNTNLIPVRIGPVSDGDDTYSVEIGDVVFEARAVGSVHGVGTGLVSIRPERAVVGLPSDLPEARANATVAETVFHGSSVLYVLRFDEAPVEFTVVVPHRGDSAVLAQGASVAVGWPSDAAQLFPDPA